MASKYLKFRGFSGYAMMYKPDEFMDKKYWKISFYPETSKVLDEMQAKGIRLKVYEDDGAKSGLTGKYLVIKRETEKKFKGVPTPFHPPEIFDKDNNPVITYDKDTFDRKGDPVLIGNGSLVEVTVVVYDAPPYGKGTRLESVRIIDLIHYEPPEEVTENEVDEDEAPKADEVLEVKPSTEKKRVKW